MTGEKLQPVSSQDTPFSTSSMPTSSAKYIKTNFYIKIQECVTCPVLQGLHVTAKTSSELSDAVRQKSVIR